MAFKDKLKVTWSPALAWRLGLALLVLICVGLGTALWMSGTQETQQAVKDSRRMVLKIAEEAPPEKAEEPKPKSDAPATAESKTPDKPESESQAEPNASLPVLPPSLSPEPAASTTAAVAAVPLAEIKAGLSEKADVGPLPIVGADGTKPWGYYAKPYERRGSQPTIAIIITGLGENKASSDMAIKLPENITLSFSPYARNTPTWATAARVSGHEVMIDLPLEPNNYPVSDPGPYGLLIGKVAQENERRLQWLMARFQGYIGFVTPQDDAFTSNQEALKPLLQSFSNRGLLLIVGREPGKSEIKDLFESSEADSLVADLLIDEELTPTAIQARLLSLQQIAKTKGSAIGIAQAYPLTMQQLTAWAAKLQTEGFVLVPVSFLAKQRFS